MTTKTMIGMIGAIMLCLLGFTAYQAQSGGFENQLAAIPKPGFSGEIDIQALEEVMQSQSLMLTYENRSEAIFTTEGQNHTMQLRCVNYTYAQVMRYPLCSGSFFSQAAQANESGQIVLNKKAAFDIFGGIDIIGSSLRYQQRPCVVVGVIDDGDTENLNVYVPAAWMGEKNTEAVMSRVDARISEAGIRNAYKSLPITEQWYNFYHLGALQQTVFNKFFLGIAVIILAILGILLQKNIAILIQYFRKGFTAANEKRPRLHILFVSVITVVQLIIFAVVAENALNMGLHWMQYPTCWPAPTVAFVEKLYALQMLGLLSDIGFAGLCIMTALTYKNLA